MHKNIKRNRFSYKTTKPIFAPIVFSANNQIRLSILAYGKSNAFATLA